MSDDVVYVPRVVEYNDNEPLGVEGRVVSVLSSSRSSRRITVLVEESAENYEMESVAETPEGVDEPTCSGKDGECSRTVDKEGDRCWQHPEEDDE
jgi:hypothetical protein